MIKYIKIVYLSVMFGAVVKSWGELLELLEVAPYLEEASLLLMKLIFGGRGNPGGYRWRTLREMLVTFKPARHGPCQMGVRPRPWTGGWGYSCRSGEKQAEILKKNRMWFMRINSPRCNWPLKAVRHPWKLAWGYFVAAIWSLKPT